MRRHLLATLAVIIALAAPLAGCGHSGKRDRAGAQSDASKPAEADVGDKARKFASCMREQGIDMPDPEVDGGRVSIAMGGGNAAEPGMQEKVEAAQAKCKQYLPDGGQPRKLDPEQLEKARQMSKCMRENGVPNFPDPDENGMIRVDGDQVGVGPDDPAMQEAQRKCDKYGGGRTNVQKQGDK